MKKKTVKVRRSYPREFKEQAVGLARGLGSRQAAEKLGIANPRTLAAWVRRDRRAAEDEERRSVEQLEAENKELRRSLAEERRNVATLKDCARFFCAGGGR